MHATDSTQCTVKQKQNMLTTKSRKCTETRKQENTVRKCYVIIIQGKQGTENTKSKCVQKNKTNSVQNTGEKKIKS